MQLSGIQLTIASRQPEMNAIANWPATANQGLLSSLPFEYEHQTVNPRAVQLWQHRMPKFWDTLIQQTRWLVTQAVHAG